MEQEIIDLLLTWWQFTIVGFIIIVAFIINLFDGDERTKARVGFSYEKMPVMRPIRIATRDKGFWGAIWLWLMTVRTWEIAEDFHYTVLDQKFVIPKGFVFDGASVPKFLATWLSPVGVLLVGGLIHDYGYKYKTLLKPDGSTIGDQSQKWMDKLFRDINIEVNGFVVLNYLAYYALRLGGFVAWNGHRKRDAQVGE